MHNESVALERAPGHFNAVEPAVGNFHGHNLRFERWERRKTDGLELDLFAAQEPLAQIAQYQGEPESCKRPALFNVDLVGHILVVFANMSSGGPRQKIHGELALHPLVLEFLPRPLFLY